MEKRKEYPARMFYRATVTCPSCSKRFRDAVENCPACGFDAYAVVKKFPFDPPTLEPVMDHSQLLSDSDRAKILSKYDRLKKTYPQFGFYTAIVNLGSSVHLPEFAFWMMNACLLQQGQTEQDRAWSILTVIDVESGNVNVTPGYAAEAFVEDGGWQAALMDVLPELQDEAYGDAMVSFLTRAEQLLHTAALFVKGKLK